MTGIVHTSLFIVGLKGESVNVTTTLPTPKLGPTTLVHSKHIM